LIARWLRKAAISQPSVTDVLTAAVLSANGRRDDARSDIQQATLDKLLPEGQAGTANLRE
jgi:hypothetical protein